MSTDEVPKSSLFQARTPASSPTAALWQARRPKYLEGLAIGAFEHLKRCSEGDDERADSQQSYAMSFEGADRCHED